eukprot:825677-Pyramimonas_sp.AAC.1
MASWFTLVLLLLLPPPSWFWFWFWLRRTQKGRVGAEAPGKGQAYAVPSRALTVGQVPGARARSQGGRGPLHARQL